MIQIPKYYYRVGVVTSIPNTGSFSRFTGASVERVYPPLLVRTQPLFTGDELGYATILDSFEIGDVLNLIVHYVDTDGEPQDFTYENEIKVI